MFYLLNTGVGVLVIYGDWRDASRALYKQGGEAIPTDGACKLDFGQ